MAKLKQIFVDLKVYFKFCHCQGPFTSGHFQPTGDSSVSVGNSSLGWPEICVRQAAANERHCQVSGAFSDSCSCHFQEAGRIPLQCQATAFSDSSNNRCRQCQHQLEVANPDTSCQSQRNCFFQLFTFFQRLLFI